MVFYHTSNVVDPVAFIYVGKDKVESEICLPPDAHVALLMPAEMRT